MKKFTAFIIAAILASTLSACGGQLSASGCRIIAEDDKHVTYQQVCTHCGYAFGDPSTVHVSHKLMYSLSCTQCGEVFNVRIQRG